MCKHLAHSAVVSAKKAGICKKSSCKAKHPYNNYKNYFPTWDIFPSDVFDSSAYWIFMMVKYEKKLAEYHERERPNMPQNWNKITLQEAKDSLRNLKS